MRAIAAAVLLLASTGALGQDDEPGARPAKKKKAAPKPREPLDASRLPFTPDSIQQVITYHREKMQACYEDTLVEHDKKVEGKIMTSFTISAVGLVKDARVLKKGTTLKDPGLHNCVVAVLSAMSFPKPPDGRDYPIEYPFNLKAIE
jgi:hypothetical protein